ncbi:MAG: TrmH family RNA methyltransferase [Dermatophilaceae bacterium]
MLTNPRSDRVRSVRALLRRSVRERTGRFLVEGPQGVREAVRWAPGRVRDVFVTADGAQRHADDVIEPARAAGLAVHEVTEEVLAVLGDAATPQGVVAVVERPSDDLDTVLARDPRRLVLLVEVRDPGNAGTVIRAADATGADAVLVSGASVDVWAPKVVRSTAGSLFHLPVVDGLDVANTLATMRLHGIRTWAADASGDTPLPHADLTSAHCWVLGNEAHGLAPEVRAACDDVVRVPIHGRAESLNLAMAAMVCLYEAANQQVRMRGAR